MSLNIHDLRKTDTQDELDIARESIKMLTSALLTAESDARAKALKEAEGIVQARGTSSCNYSSVDPTTGAFECRYLDRGECNCCAFDELADAIHALAEKDSARSLPTSPVSESGGLHRKVSDFLSARYYETVHYPSNEADRLIDMIASKALEKAARMLRKRAEKYRESEYRVYCVIKECAKAIHAIAIQDEK